MTIPFDWRNLVHGQVASKRNCQIITQCKDFTPLVSKVIDELWVLTILASEDLFQLKDRCVDGLSPVALKHVDDTAEGMLADHHLPWAKVSSALCRLEHQFLTGRGIVADLSLQSQQLLHFPRDLHGQPTQHPESPHEKRIFVFSIVLSSTETKSADRLHDDQIADEKWRRTYVNERF